MVLCWAKLWVTLFSVLAMRSKEHGFWSIQQSLGMVVCLEGRHGMAPLSELEAFVVILAWNHGVLDRAAFCR